MIILQALFPSKEKASAPSSSSLGNDLRVGSGHNQEVPPPIYSWWYHLCLSNSSQNNHLLKPTCKEGQRIQQ